MTASYSLIPLVFGVGGIVFVVWGLRARGTLGALPQDWVPVKGTVIDASRPQRIEYRTPDGRRLRLQGVLDSSLAAGDEVDVLIDPADASRARLVDIERATASLSRTLLIVGIVSFVAAVLAAIAFA